MYEAGEAGNNFVSASLGDLTNVQSNGVLFRSCYVRATAVGFDPRRFVPRFHFNLIPYHTDRIDGPWRRLSLVKHEVPSTSVVPHPTSGRSRTRREINDTRHPCPHPYEGASRLHNAHLWEISLHTCLCNGYHQFVGYRLLLPVNVCVCTSRVMTGSGSNTCTLYTCQAGSRSRTNGQNV